MAADDLFSDEHQDFLAPALDGVAVTPNDGTDLPFVTRAIWIGGAGNISVVMKGTKGNPGATILLSGIPAGTLLPLSVSRVRATTTTATLIVALW